ncbi:hypothetical protein Bca4012_044548 [Brassica carinata]|uniref:Uncharacterized protein n=2 Tax=Brassica TaxID=3705 RepID=A0A0D3EAK7_BRAOL|nr:hypothetical protein Bca52824_057956 [Brassica carinata]
MTMVAEELTRCEGLLAVKDERHELRRVRKIDGDGGHETATECGEGGRRSPGGLVGGGVARLSGDAGRWAITGGIVW